MGATVLLSLKLYLVGYHSSLPVYLLLLYWIPHIGFSWRLTQCSVFSVFWSSLFSELRWQKAQAHSVHVWVWAHTHWRFVCGCLWGLAEALWNRRAKLGHMCAWTSHKRIPPSHCPMCAFLFRLSHALLFLFVTCMDLYTIWNPSLVYHFNF